jgi:hypothetical protein
LFNLQTQTSNGFASQIVSEVIDTTNPLDTEFIPGFRKITKKPVLDQNFTTAYLGRVSVSDDGKMGAIITYSRGSYSLKTFQVDPVTGVKTSRFHTYFKTRNVLAEPVIDINAYFTP